MPLIKVLKSTNEIAHCQNKTLDSFPENIVKNLSLVKKTVAIIINTRIIARCSLCCFKIIKRNMSNRNKTPNLALTASIVMSVMPAKKKNVFFSILFGLEVIKNQSMQQNKR